jgi:hypothetical protein
MFLTTTQTLVFISRGRGAEIAGGKENMRKNALKLIAGVLLLANIVILAGSVQSEPAQAKTCREVQISTGVYVCQ